MIIMKAAVAIASDGLSVMSVADLVLVRWTEVSTSGTRPTICLNERSSEI